MIFGPGVDPTGRVAAAAAAVVHNNNKSAAAAANLTEESLHTK